MKKKILFTTPELAYPPAKGPHLRITNSIKALALISELHLVSQVSAGELGAGPEGYYRSLVKAFSYAPFCTPQNTASNAQFLVDYVRTNQIDVVWLGYGNISYPLAKQLRALKPDLKIVSDTDSVWSQFVLRELPFCSDVARQRELESQGLAKAREEEEGVQIADVTTAVSEVDAKYYRQLAKDKSKVHIFSNVIDLDMYKNIPPKAPELSQPYLYLAGTFYADTAPMTKAARWLLSEIWPLIRQKRPDASVVILGNGADKHLADIKQPGVVVKGYVDSVLPYLCHAAVAVVPLKFESGTRFKILEAATCRIPIVSTTLGAEGLPVVHDRDVLLGDTAEDFATACVRLLDNPQEGKRLAESCFGVVDKAFTVNALAREGNSILNFLYGTAEQTQVVTSQNTLSGLKIPQSWSTMVANMAPAEAVRCGIAMVVEGSAPDEAVAFLAGNQELLFQALGSCPDATVLKLTQRIEELATRVRAETR